MVLMSTLVQDRLMEPCLRQAMILASLNFSATRALLRKLLSRNLMGTVHMSQISCSQKTQQGNRTLYPQGVRINQFSSGNLARIAKPNKKACVQPRLKSNKRNRSLLRKMKEVFSKKKTLVRVTRNSALTPFWGRSRQAPHQVSNFNHT